MRAIDTSPRVDGDGLARRAAGPPRGILRELPEGAVEHRRVVPSATVARYVAHFWSVRWALDAPFLSETLPHPSLHIVFEMIEGRDPRAQLHGVVTGRFSKRLEGRGEVFGIKFRPAAFPLGAPTVRLTDHVIPLDRVLGEGAHSLTRAIVEADGLAAKIEAAESLLAPLLPPLADEAACLRDLVERIATDRTLLRVEDVAALVGLDVRTLQRRFRHHVGVSPKWVIQRYRLHEAAEQIRSASAPSLAALARALGYADQAHFSRDFKRVVGRNPSELSATQRGRNALRREERGALADAGRMMQTRASSPRLRHTSRGARTREGPREER